MARKDLTLNVLSNNSIRIDLKFVNTITRVLTIIFFIAALVLYYKNENN
ncbi:MAG TPA: hypothetical protein VJ962_10890 [Clostridia bacterium]|nr:hypothetical protein [Clostridia bacterium]